MSRAEPASDEVAGERSAALVQRARGLQSRLGGVLASTLMIAIGAGALGWYYVHIWHVRGVMHAGAGYEAVVAASQDPALPPLGRIDPPSVPHVPPGAPAPRAPLAIAPAASGVAPALAAAPEPIAAELARPVDSVRPPSPQALARARRLSGAAFVAPAPAADSSSTGPTMGGRHASADRDALERLMRPTVTTAVDAERLPTMRMLLPKGSFIDCTLETAIDSTLPGFTTCITATDTYGADGEVVLLERGTKLVGEVRDQVRQGMARLFVLWTEARTPDGIVVPLDSPGTDALGRAGLPGRVDRHFWQRFGAAMLISVVDAGVQAGVQASNRGGGTLIVNPAGSEDVMTEALRSTVDIPPTIVLRQGARIQVLVARDLDFRSVYALRLAARKAPQ